MRSTVSLANATKKPEIVANVPKVTFEKTKSETALNNEDEKDKVIGSQPVKRRSKFECLYTSYASQLTCYSKGTVSFSRDKK